MLSAVDSRRKLGRTGPSAVQLFFRKEALRAAIVSFFIYLSTGWSNKIDTPNVHAEHPISDM